MMKFAFSEDAANANLSIFAPNFFLTNFMVQQLSEQEKIRRQSLHELIELGINPYPPEELSGECYRHRNSR
jgi:hypothetical protein